MTLMQSLTLKSKLKKERKARTRESILNILGLLAIHREAVTAGKKGRTLGNQTEDENTTVEMIANGMTTMKADEIGSAIEGMMEREEGQGKEDVAHLRKLMIASTTEDGLVVIAEIVEIETKKLPKKLQSSKLASFTAEK